MINSQEMILKENSVMETSRCLLRKISLDNIDDMYDYCSMEEVTRYTKFSQHQSKEETKTIIETIFIPKQLTKWGIELKETNKLIGTVDFMSIDKDCATIGYALSPKYWGRGIVPEVAERLLQLSFEELDLKVVYATHHKDNLNSGKVMQKIGMKKIGTDYYFNFKDKPLVETMKYAITFEDYFKR